MTEPDPYELACSIALCGVIEGSAPKDFPTVLKAPPGWVLAFDSPVIGGYGNKWQLWKSPGGRYGIVIRGTVASLVSSVIEDLLAVMIPAASSIGIPVGRLPYRFALDPNATVHLGFALGALTLLLDGANGILAKLDQLVPGGSPVFVTGHSQGAAISTLIRAFFEYSPLVSPECHMAPGYHWAQPKPGNDHFARDFERIESQWRITNSLDWVPQVPLTLQCLDTLNAPNPLSVLPGAPVIEIVGHVLNTLAGVVGSFHMGKFAPLAHLLDPATIYPPAGKTVIPGAGGLPALAGGFNFEPAGVPITLEGKPGVNPADSSDCAWQHHAAMYAALLAGEI